MFLANGSGYYSCVNELLSAVGNDILHSKEAILCPSLCTCMTCILMLFMYGFRLVIYLNYFKINESINGIVSYSYREILFQLFNC